MIMLVPALSTVAPGAARARRGRQAAISGVSRAGADLALVLLAVLAGWQLRHYSAVSAGANGNFGIDPVVVIAPALALAGGTVAGAAPAAGGRQGRGPAGRPRPAADRRAGELADQPPADPAGRCGAADRAGRGDRDAGAVAAAELDALRS